MPDKEEWKKIAQGFEKMLDTEIAKNKKLAEEN